MKKVISILLALGLVAQIGLFSAFAAPKVAVISIKVAPASITLAVGNTGTVKATVLPATATNKAVSWKSSNTAVAKIDSTGKVTALSIGFVTITCTAKDGSGKKAVSKVTVVVKPTTKAQILAAYTTVMNKAKSAKPAYSKVEYQALPKDKINITKASIIISPLLNLAGNFMTTEEKAKQNPGINAKGGNMKGFPVKNAPKGCMLTNVSAVKTASCTVLSNGNYKITIVLNDETNPEHYKTGNTAPSKTGSMFYPLSKSDIDPELSSGLVKAVIGNASYSLKYYNCTSTLVYNPKTNQIVSLDQVTYTLINMSGKVINLVNASGTAVLEMYYKFFNLKY
ncbi:MAG: Ig-like domain-containing protein [Eubacteriales bacterium]